MKATIVNYVDKNHYECYSIGNEAMVDEIKKNSLQVIRSLDINVTEQERYELGDKTQEELISMMSDTMDNSIYSIYHN